MTNIFGYILIPLESCNLGNAKLLTLKWDEYMSLNKKRLLKGASLSTVNLYIKVGPFPKILVL